MSWDRRRLLVESRFVALVLLLALAMVIGAAMQYALGTLGPHITSELGLSKVRYALLPAGLSLSGSLLSPFAGRLVDVYGARRTTLALFAVAVGSALLVVSATAYVQLLAAAVLMGLPMALANPATNQAVNRGVTARRQGTVVGYKQAGVPLSIVFAGLLLPAIADAAGWRVAMAAMALPALGGLLLAPLLLPRHAPGGTPRHTPSGTPHPTPGDTPHHTPGDTHPTPGDAPHPPAAPSARLARLLALYALLMGLGQGAISAFLPLYVHERLGRTVASAGLLVAAVGVSSIVARIFWGYVANRSAALLSVLRHLAFVACGSALLVLVAGVADWRLVWVGAVGFGFTSGAWHTPMWVAIIRRFGDTAGHVSGRVTRGFFLGLMLSPVIFGVLLDAGAGYLAAWAVVASMFLGAGFVRPDVRAAAGA